MARLEQHASGGHPPRERLERMLLAYFDADPQVFEIWMLAREMTTRAIREPIRRPDPRADQAAWRLTVTVEGLGTWLLTGMATRRQCRELVRNSLLRKLA
jgi:hypothetical protein